MKILHYCRRFSPLSQTFIYDVITELDYQKIYNLVLTKQKMNETERPYSNVMELSFSKGEKLILKSLKILKKLGLKNLFSKIKLKIEHEKIQKILEEERPQVIHAHFGPSGFEILPVAKKLNISLIVSFHGYDAFRLPENSTWKKKLQEVFDGATAITVVSSVMKEHLISKGCPSEKLEVIHVGKKINEYPYNGKIPRNIKNFISIGRLTEKKGFEDCIKAFKILVEEDPEICLSIIGEGDLEKALKDQVKQNSLEKHVKFLGPLSHSLTKNQLMNSDAFILCSKTASNGDQEGIPTVLMEAQALGLPCISTFHSGIPEVIPLENHWLLAEEGNYNDIASRIMKLRSTDYDILKYSIGLGREKIENEFNLELEVKKIKNLYSKVLQ